MNFFICDFVCVDLFSYEKEVVVNFVNCNVN